MYKRQGQTYKQLAKTHEYILTYTKNVLTELNELNKGQGAFDKKEMCIRDSHQTGSQQGCVHGRTGESVWYEFRIYQQVF